VNKDAFVVWRRAGQAATAPAPKDRQSPGQSFGEGGIACHENSLVLVKSAVSISYCEAFAEPTSLGGTLSKELRAL
jgi:hypothetical protein